MINDIHTTDNPLAKDYTLFSLLLFAMPTITMMLFMGLYTIMDTVLISNLVNTDALSAINIVCPVINVIVGIGTMFATGGSAIVAKKMGEGKDNRANQDFTLIFLFSVLIGLVITILGIYFIDDIIWSLGASKILFPYCKDYLFIILLFTPASILQILFQTLIVTAGKPTFGLVLSISAGVINVVLDYTFMTVFNMGIMGAALGTAIGYVIPAMTGIVFFKTKRGTLSFEKPILDIRVLTKSCGNGVSEMVSQISTAITTFFFNYTMMCYLGENGVASITIIIYTQFLMTTLYIGFSMAVSPILSFNYGAKRHIHLQRIFKQCLYFIAISSLLIFTIASLFSKDIIQLFVDKESIVYAIAYSGFIIFLFSLLFSGINIFSSASFTAFSNGKVSAIISFFRSFVFIILCLLILPKFMGVTGVWLAIPLAEGLSFCVSLFYIFTNQKKYHYL